MKPGEIDRSFASNELGAIAPGAYADVIAVSGDPLKNIRELENVRFVMQAGRIFKNELAK